MSFINVSHISKTFKVAKKQSGFKATLKNFIKREYKYIDAIKDISFNIEEGSIVGYIGQNGAGKSTTIKILSGILIPDSGEVTIDGLTPWKDRKEYVSKIGVVFGHAGHAVKNDYAVTGGGKAYSQNGQQDHDGCDNQGLQILLDHLVSPFSCASHSITSSKTEVLSS